MNTYQQIKDLLMSIYKIDNLNNILFIHGGTIPYLISNTNSKRNHGDIDFVVRAEDMKTIRKFLKEYDIYDPNKDSLSKTNEDYGVSAIIRNIEVGFYPFEVSSDGIQINSFSIFEKYQLKKRFIKGLTLDDFIEYIDFYDWKIGITSRELNYLLKKNITREKDLIDLEIYNKIEMDSEKIKRLEELDISKYSSIEDYIVSEDN